MQFLRAVFTAFAALCLVAADSSPVYTGASAQPQTSTAGIEALVSRRLGKHESSFTFELVNATSASGVFDQYTVTTPSAGNVLVQGTTLSALAVGLRRYLTEECAVDLYWFIGNRLNEAPAILPTLSTPLTGSAVVPWRYHFNTVTFSYTTAFWDFADWELELDWLALHGVNLPLAWNGYEYFLNEVFEEIGFTSAELSTFFSGPAFQAWNRFGNIQGSWGGDLPTTWLVAQKNLNKKIVERMVALGMTPVLPAFTGFVPQAITRVAPNATVVNGSAWEAFPTQNTNTTFLEPDDPLFTQLQTSLLNKQLKAYGNVTHFFALDQYNENNPYSGSDTYLSSITNGTMASLKTADPDAVWLMQGWLFYSNSAFWTNDRIEAYLGGVTNNDDMLILDLFSESQPQWQRTNSYFGKPWIWCQLHDYGGNQGLYGQVENVTINPIAALANSSSLVGFGLTMEGQEGNEIMYDLLLDQAWSSTPLDTASYFEDWVTARYNNGNGKTVPTELYAAWDLLRTTVYNNTNLTSNAVVKSIVELAPALSGLTNRTGHHPTTLDYAYSSVITAWNLFANASAAQPGLYNNNAFTYDFTDLTRQVLVNAFIPLYQNLLTIYTSPNSTNSTSTTNTTNSSLLSAAASNLTSVINTLDTVLMTNENFLLSTWIASATSWATKPPSAASTTNTTLTAAYLEYNARNQITLWGPTGQISDYASKQWGGLVREYYLPRWQMWVEYLQGTGYAEYSASAWGKQLLAFEEAWQVKVWGQGANETFGTVGDLKSVLEGVVREWPGVFQRAAL